MRASERVTPEGQRSGWLEGAGRSDMKRGGPDRQGLVDHGKEDRSRGRDVSLLGGSSSPWRLWGEQPAGG